METAVLILKPLAGLRPWPAFVLLTGLTARAHPLRPPRASGTVHWWTPSAQRLGSWGTSWSSSRAPCRPSPP